MKSPSIQIYHYHKGSRTIGAVSIGNGEITCKGICGGKSEECARVATLQALEKILLLASGPAAGLLLPKVVTQTLKAAYELLHTRQQEARGEMSPGSFDRALKEFQASASAPIRAAAAAAQELAKAQAMASSAASAMNEKARKK